MTARPIASDLSAMPGPDEAVSASAPPYDAPIAAPIAAICPRPRTSDPERLVAGQLVEDVRRGGDGCCRRIAPDRPVARRSGTRAPWPRKPVMFRQTPGRAGGMTR
jgi:hypothetical protein